MSQTRDDQQVGGVTDNIFLHIRFSINWNLNESNEAENGDETKDSLGFIAVS